MTLLEWNLHKMLTSKTVEPYVCDEIIDANTDAICLVEYLHDDFIINCLREKYYIAETNNDGGNDILVAVNKTIVKNGIRIIKKTEVAGCYRFLHIAYNSQDDKEINLIGIRMLSPIDASIQTPELNRYLRQLTNQNKSFICTGDFNILRHKMSQKWFPSFKMTGIEDTSERYSYIYANKYTYTITGYGVVDHVLLSRDLTGFSSYSWKFADKQPSIYPTKRNIGDKWKISVACPDHAIMISHIERLPNE